MIFCHLPHLYPAADSSEIEEESWNAFDAIISLLQTNFRLCKKIFLVLWTENRVFPDEPQLPGDRVIAQLERVLCQVDELFQILDSRGCEFSIFPSPVAFDAYLGQVKETGGVFEEGDFDRNRGAESRIWRSVKIDPSKERLSENAGKESKSGYWLRTNFFDWTERPDMHFV
jgi:hypothetical protein